MSPRWLSLSPDFPHVFPRLSRFHHSLLGRSLSSTSHIDDRGNRVPNILAGVIIPMPFAALALVLRIKARRMTKMGLGIDDCLSACAWVFAVGYSTLVLIWTADYKLGQRIGDLPQSRIDYYLENSRLILWISEFFYSWSIFLSKMAVLTFFRRIFRLLPLRWPILFLEIACIIWIIIRTFMTIFRCWPVHYSWDRAAHGHCGIDVAEYWLATDTTHTLLDILILSLPIYEVSRMSLPFAQKMAVVGLFSCGLIVCIASVFQIVQSQNYDAHSVEVPYQLAYSMIWGTVEVQLAVFTSCLALLRPIFRKVIPGLTSSSRSAGGGDSLSYAISHPNFALRSSKSHRSPFRSPRDVETAGSDDQPIASHAELAIPSGT